MSFNKDILAPEIIRDTGAVHPINHMKDSILNLLVSFGFEIIDGPEIETEKFNFDMLNIKESHPARQMHDTFYVNKKDFVLRTHTSPVQIRAMLDRDLPIKFISHGKVYRKDDDATHLPMFNQIEAIHIDRDINFANLKDLIYEIITALFGKDIKLRFRPSFFPFTEPSAEVDILSNDGNWIEILGCGIVNPIVLENCGINSSEYKGLAFGLGVERIAMLKFEMNDIREFYKSNLDFLEQFI